SCSSPPATRRWGSAAPRPSRAAWSATSPAWRRRPVSLSVRRTLALRPRQLAKPARQVPVPAAEQAHGRREDHRADNRCVEQERDCDTEAHLLELDEIALREAREDRDDDQRRTRDDPGGRAHAPSDGGRRIARLVVALLDPAEQ